MGTFHSNSALIIHTKRLMALAVLLNVLGVVLIVLALHDIFHQLFHRMGADG